MGFRDYEIKLFPLCLSIYHFFFENIKESISTLLKRLNSNIVKGIDA